MRETGEEDDGLGFWIGLVGQDQVVAGGMVCNKANCLVGAESRRQRIRSWKQVRGHERTLQISNGSQ